MPKTRQQVMQKYQQRMQSSGQAYKDGVNNPRRSWSQSYIDNVDRMVLGLQQAIAQNKPQQAVQQLGDDGFKRKTLAKADRFTASVPAAVDGYGAVVDKVLAAGEAASQAAAAIPGTTLEERLQRVPAAVHATRRHWGKE